jgi:hypothetical protein
MDNQRDYDEEEYHRAEMKREAIEELQDVTVIATESHSDRYYAVKALRVESERRKSFTLMSAAGLVEMILAQEDTHEPYPMELNTRDFHNLIIALNNLYESDDVHDDLKEWASLMVSSIATTLGIEMI